MVILKKIRLLYTVIYQLQRTDNEHRLWIRVECMWRVVVYYVWLVILSLSSLCPPVFRCCVTTHYVASSGIPLHHGKWQHPICNSSLLYVYSTLVARSLSLSPYVYVLCHVICVCFTLYVLLSHSLVHCKPQRIQHP